MCFRTQLREIAFTFRTQRAPSYVREVSRFFSCISLCKEIYERNPDPIYNIGSLTPLMFKHCGLVVALE